MGTLQYTLGHDAHAAMPASPDLLTNIEGVGGLLVPQVQVQDIRGLRVMPEPQGHSQDDASGQLGRKQREAPSSTDPAMPDPELHFQVGAEDLLFVFLHILVYSFHVQEHPS